MKKILLFLFLAGYVIPGNAQSIQDTTRKRSRSTFRNFSIGFPVWYSGYCLSSQGNKAGTLPSGMNYYLKDVKSTSESFFPITHNYNFRLLALYFKDKIGIEVFYSGYGGPVERDGFDTYLANRYAGYYIQSILFSGKNEIYSFNGWRFGLTYKFHYHHFIVQPELMIGFEKGTSGVQTDYWQLKEIGSNQFTDLRINTFYPERKNSYHAQLNIARQY